jgi:hypothetical protein
MTEEQTKIWNEYERNVEQNRLNILKKEEYDRLRNEFKRNEEQNSLNKLRKEEQDRILEEENSLIEEQNNLLEENNRLLREINYSQQRNEQDKIWEQYKRDKEYEEQNAYKNASWYLLGYPSEQAYTNSIFGKNKRR